MSKRGTFPSSDELGSQGSIDPDIVAVTASLSSFEEKDYTYEYQTEQNLGDYQLEVCPKFDKCATAGNKCFQLSGSGTLIQKSVTLTGDMNGDGQVDVMDSDLIKAHVGQAINAQNAKYDANHDGAISSADVTYVKIRYGNTLPKVCGS